MVRIKDIAEKAGVSTGTVDRVLHNRGEVAEKTRQLVLKIAKELNYKPNIAAQTLASGKSYNISVIIPEGRNENIFWKSHLTGIKNALSSLQPFRVNVSFYLFELNNEKDFIEKSTALLNEPCDGVIVAPVLKNETLDFCNKLDELNIPYLFIDTFIKDTNCLAFIGEDAYQSGRIAASLIDFGLSPEKDILIVNISKNLDNTQHLNSRNQGFLSYFMDAGRNTGLKISVEIPTPEQEDVTAKLNPIFKNNPGIGAIMVSSSKTYAIAKYLEQKGMKDVILVGYEIFDENIRYLKKRYIDFLIGQRPEEQGEKALLKLFNYIAYNSIPDKKEFQAVDIINCETLPLINK
ncbi:MAG: LacI family transcriptional regulator [Chlorobi bacterium]|nr:LacI family transcriptional regulator [Chlorobiota bacterium]